VPTDGATSIRDLFNQAGTGHTVIFQDRNGDHWFAGSDTGVFRYDGKDPVLYTTADGLCGTGVLGIQEDAEGKLYFDTTEGVCVFDGKVFTTLTVDSTASPDAWKLEPGDLWFRMGWDHHGPFRYDGTTLHALEFPHTTQADTFNTQYPNVSFDPYGIYSMYTDSKGRLWFGTSSLGVCMFDGTSIRWLYKDHLTNTPAGGSFGIRAMIEDRDGKFWFCNTRERFTIPPQTADGDRVQNSTSAGVQAEGETHFPYFFSITKDKAGNLWMACGEDGVYCKRGELLVHYPITTEGETVRAFSIYTNNVGTIWIGTLGSGAYRFNGAAFERFDPAG
jgi:ligand-binding sensor domain-containing protein